MDPMIIVWVAGLIAVAFAAYLARDVLSRDQGTPAMQEVAGAIFEGAMAFLNRQYRTIWMIAIVAAVIIGFVLYALEPDRNLAFDLGWRTAVAFLVGAACSSLAGFIGMYIAVKSNLRTASAAQRSLQEAITVALRGGAVSGFLVVALSLLGVALIFYAFGGAAEPDRAPFLIVGFGFGASFVALFAQLGGGIYTKAADVGADLVGKVEAGIPEDDPRNAAVIADLVGDNVGDCAGRGADLFESTAAENIGAMILGVAIYAALPPSTPHREFWILFPLVVRAFGLLASLVGILLARGNETEDPMRALDRGYWVAAGLSAVSMVFVANWMLGDMHFALAGLVGIATSIAFVYITQYYTAGSWRPVREIAAASKTGHATNIISGVAVGFETTAMTAIVISVALGLAFWLGTQSSVLPAALDTHKGIYGTAIATMGMLMTAAYILAMDTFGPITDNAGGITEMSHAPEGARRITDALDAVGNTTKALTKGYAVASAALAAFLLFSAYLDRLRELRHLPATQALPVDLSRVDVFIGAFLGAMLIFLFSSLAIRAVGRAAGDIIEEVRRQFKANPLLLEGKARPDYGRCVDITTRAALREMVAPGLLAVLAPIAVGLVLKAEAEAGLLMVGTMSGILVATVLNNGGGAWDNAKKFIEAGNLKDETGNVIGKGSFAHQAAVTGDTVGDPFKDTAGPSLHVLIKLLSTITLVMAPLFLVR
ncbi:MAG TPA: sodium-translocating pyrophosphatase [Chloroflexota bacterium]|nr:sodium-translocating pyrophosphatase [Chloroflexota bacterium]